MIVVARMVAVYLIALDGTHTHPRRGQGFGEGHGEDAAHPDLWPGERGGVERLHGTPTPRLAVLVVKELGLLAWRFVRC